MTSLLNPYVVFNHNTREAMEFYRDVFGGELEIMPFSAMGPADGVDPDGVMHSRLETPSGFTLMASDPPPGMDAGVGGPVSISLSGDNDAELRGYWDALSGSGEIQVPLALQMWGDTFGQCVDQFGISWVVNISGAAAV